MSNTEDKLINQWTEDTGFFSPESTNPDRVIQFDKSTGEIHNALMALGMTPVIGNMADIADAILYTAEGEFGSAGLAAVASMPIIGQFATGQKILKKAKDAGEDIITVFRGVDKWHPGQMVKDGKFVSGAKRVGPTFNPKENMPVKDILYTTTSKSSAEGYAQNLISGSGRNQVWGLTQPSKVLEFQIPRGYFEKNVKDYMGGKSMAQVSEKGVAVWGGGLPKEFLVKVHKYGE